MSAKRQRVERKQPAVAPALTAPGTKLQLADISAPIFIGAILPFFDAWDMQDAIFLVNRAFAAYGRTEPAQRQWMREAGRALDHSIENVDENKDENKDARDDDQKSAVDPRPLGVQVQDAKDSLKSLKFRCYRCKVKGCECCDGPREALECNEHQFKSNKLFCRHCIDKVSNDLPAGAGMVVRQFGGFCFVCYETGVRSCVKRRTGKVSEPVKR